MYWESESWRPVEPGQAPNDLALILSGLDYPDPNLFVLAGSTGGRPDFDSLAVASMRKRVLPFYPRYWLYELTLALVEGSLWRHTFESVRAFVVVGPIPEAPFVPLEAPPKVTSTLLDWKSGSLRALNALVGTDLVRRHLPEYLDFYTSFLAGDADSPFLLLERAMRPARSVFEPAGIGSLEESIARILGRRGGLYHRPPRRRDFPGDALRADPPDLFGGDAAPVSSSLPRNTLAQSGTPATPPPPPSPPSGGGPAGAPFQDVRVLDGGATSPNHFTLAATVVYDGLCYAATFRVEIQSQEALAVTMADSDLVRWTERPFARYRAMTTGPSRVPVLGLLTPRRHITSGEFIRRVTTAQAIATPWWESVVENLRVTGDVHCELVSGERPIAVRDVEFIGNVSLAECRRRGSVVFESCKFARRVEAANASIDGDLVLRHCIVYGALADEASPRPSLVLDGADISGALVADQLAVDGQVSADHLTVARWVSLRGIDVIAPNRRVALPSLVSFCNAKVGSVLRLDAFERRDPGALRSVRSRIEGALDLTGLHAEEVDLRGGVFDSVQMSNAHVEHAVQMQCLEVAGTYRWPVEQRHFRTRLTGSLYARGLQAGELLLSGVAVAGEVELVYAKVGAGILARVEPYGPFRPRIGASVSLSGAVVGGDCDWSGAAIGGRIEFWTGSAGRLVLTPEPAVSLEGDLLTTGQWSTELGSLSVSNVTGLHAVQLTGLVVRPAPGGEAPIQLRNTLVQGDLELHGSLSEQYFREFFEIVARSVPAEMWMRRARGPEPTFLVPALDLTGSQFTLSTRPARGVQTAPDREVLKVVGVLKKMQPPDRRIWARCERELRDEARPADADLVYRAMKDDQPTGWPPFKWVHRQVFGYGTQPWRAAVVAMVATLLLLLALLDPHNVGWSPAWEKQLADRCRNLAAAESGQPPDCERFWALENGGSALGAAEAGPEELGTTYSLGEALVVTLRYAVPLLAPVFSALEGDSAWVPARVRDAELFCNPRLRLPITPLHLAEAIFLLNTLLLAFVAAFVSRRWLR